MQRYGALSEVKNENLPRDILPFPKFAAEKLLPRSSAGAISRKQIEAFADGPGQLQVLESCDGAKPVSGGQTTDIDVWKENKNAPETAVVSRAKQIYPFQFTTRELYNGSRRPVLLPLPVNVPQSSGQSSSKSRYPRLDPRSSPRSKRSPTKARDRLASPRKLLWPTEESSYMTQNLERGQVQPLSKEKDTGPHEQIPQGQPVGLAITTDEINPRDMGDSPSRNSNPQLNRRVYTGASYRRERFRIADLPATPVAPKRKALLNHQSTSLPHLEPGHETPSRSSALLVQELGFDPAQPASQPQENSVAIESTPAPRTVTVQTADDLIPSVATQSELSHTRYKYLEAKKLPHWQVWVFRIVFGGVILAANISLLITYFLTNHHQYLLAILVFMKSKDLLSTMADVLGLSYQFCHRKLFQPKPVDQKWVLSLISAYAETDDQIMKTIDSLVCQELTPHKQVICVIVDGKDPDVLTHFASMTHMFKQSYTTWKGGNGELAVYAGFIQSTPVIFIKKARNAGKKDSLILGHDLFNHPRKNMPLLTQQFRDIMSTRVLPELTSGNDFQAFDGIFCTDADSIIHKEALRELANALARDPSAIAACGILVAELAVPAVEWTAWHLYQQYQYTFGQFVRRQAEGIWGRVTCLPGCITMIAVRPEMGPAIAKYARPVLTTNLVEHQVQYLGTDRRLTWCMLSQSSRLNSLLVPAALCETVVPDNLEHYLSQRRRWASNAYFNDFYYAFGRQQRLITRLFAFIDIIRQSLVFYRVINTALFIRSLILHFYIIKLTPTLILTKTPALWFLLLALIRTPVLRKRFHKLLVGMCINQFISPILSVIVFANVLLNVGSQVWGKTGLSSADSRPASTLYPLLLQPPATPGQSWSPRRLASIVRVAVRGFGTRSDPAQDAVTAEKTTDQSGPISDVRDFVPTTPISSATPSTWSTVRRRTPKDSWGMVQKP